MCCEKDNIALPRSPKWAAYMEMMSCDKWHFTHDDLSQPRAPRRSLSDTRAASLSFHSSSHIRQ